MAKNENKANKTKKHFFKEFKAELKKVIWPTPKQLVNSTIAVIVIVLVCATIVLALDVVFETINEKGISNLQSIVDEKFNVDEEEGATEQEITSEDSTESNEEAEVESESETEITDENADTTVENTETPAEGEQTNVEE